MESYHEIVCPEYAHEDGSSVVYVPWFLIIGRPYPIQVYLYACDLYSSEQGYGQREVAKATREKFKLKTFSHSTVCRSFKTLKSHANKHWNTDLVWSSKQATVHVQIKNRQVTLQTIPKSSVQGDASRRSKIQRGAGRKWPYFLKYIMMLLRKENLMLPGNSL